MLVSREIAFKMLKNDICNTEFEVGQAFRVLLIVYIQNTKEYMLRLYARRQINNIN